MKKEHSHDVIQRLISGSEDAGLKGLLSIDRIFEALLVGETEEDYDKQDQILASRQRAEEATATEILLERLLVMCIRFWDAGIINSMEILHSNIKIAMPLELGERYWKLVEEKTKGD
jgi:hypothetical protein